MPFAARFSCCATIDFNSILKYFHRGMMIKFHVYHCSFKKHFRLWMHIMGAWVKCSLLDGIGTIVFYVTVLYTATYEKHATKSFEIIKAIIDENENPETMCGTEVLQILDWWIMSFIFHPNLILVMILFLTSFQMVCLDEIDNYVEIVLISCMTWNNLSCRKHDTGYPRTNVCICSERKERGRHDGRWLVSSRCWRTAFAEIFQISHGGSKKMLPATFKRTTKKRILRPRFSRKNCKELFTFFSAMVKRHAG